jgi:ABC-2 type transport system ATP-binding protein
MADIQELCKRVIIIDKGKIFFDGRLAEILDRFADFKIVTISWEIGASFPTLDFTAYGQVVEQNPNRIQLKVKRDSAIAVCKELLDKVPVNDIDIQDVPIEEVIRQIFAR